MNDLLTEKGVVSFETYSCRMQSNVGEDGEWDDCVSDKSLICTSVLRMNYFLQYWQKKPWKKSLPDIFIMTVIVSTSNPVKSLLKWWRKWKIRLPQTRATLWTSLLIQKQLYQTVCAGIHKTTALKTQRYERGKSKENPVTDCKYFAWHLQSCFWKAVRFEDGTEGRALECRNDTHSCCTCKLWERRFGYIIEMVLKMHSVLLFTGISVPKQGSFASFEDLSSPRCACSHGGSRVVCLLLLFPVHSLSICWFCSRQHSKGEGRTQQCQIKLFCSAHSTRYWSGTTVGIQQQSHQLWSRWARCS